ncbi:hypothetical protein [Mucilaginibacter psychrotolerans]|uniref:hypothetical protein n=1 Tax=Mucilaginibacter psychrotolerans TaxID=1524096 RepID=UPI001F0027D6|nr:hypothetical protein [Mucilaginibacter psychrotolerans]
MKVDSASKPEWDRQKQLITDKRNNFNQGIADLRAIAGATGVNLDGLISGIQQQVTSLDGTLSNLTNLENSTQVYALRGGVTEVGGTTLNPQNHIITFAFGTTANFIHETTHGGQFEAGEIAFNSRGAIVGQDVNDEISAYQRQFAYDPSSVSGLRSSSVANTLGAINATWVQGITTSTGDRIYAPGGTANTGISPVNINSDRAALMRAYPNIANQLQSLPANFTLKSIPGLYYKH